MIIPVILSGGSGTRLWPLSTPEKPKQFLPLVSDRTLFQETLLRLQGLPDLADPIVVCNEAHRFLVAEQLEEIGAKARAIVLEPAGRNTAPAIAVAAILAKKGSDPFLLVLPADHVIVDGEAFRAAVSKATRAAQAGNLVSFGIVPTHPETGYGYIEQGEAAGAEDGSVDWLAVERFVEKPDPDTARAYVDSGRFLWNSGMFVFGANRYLEELGEFVPDITSACERAVAGAGSDQSFTRLGDAFLESPSDSIDYAVMEKTSQAAVVPLDAGWSDVGSWSALYEVLAKDEAGNAFRGNVVTLDAGGNLVLTQTSKVALLGLEGLVVIDAGDTLLVMSKDRSQDVKALQEKARSEAD